MIFFVTSYNIWLLLRRKGYLGDADVIAQRREQKKLTEDETDLQMIEIQNHVKEELRLLEEQKKTKSEKTSAAN